MPKRDLYELWETDGYPLHIQRDMENHNDNFSEGMELCEKCEGTGNQLYSMYQKCDVCLGKGHMGRKRNDNV